MFQCQLEYQNFPQDIFHINTTFFFKSQILITFTYSTFNNNISMKIISKLEISVGIGICMLKIREHIKVFFNHILIISLKHISMSSWSIFRHLHIYGYVCIFVCMQRDY